jgi:hypothetical protein
VRKGAFILLLGLVVCTAAFTGVYYLGTASSRNLMRQPEPELAWLKKEFQLGDAEFLRVSQMHAEYLPRCRDRCMRIAQQNERLQELVARSTNITPEIRDLLAERATMRAECEAEMLTHFLAVSRTMPPDQGQRYLAWVQSQSSLWGGAMENQHRTAEAHHHH